MLTFDCKENMKTVFGVNRIQGATVKIEPLRKPNLIPQFKRCQLHGHMQKYCQRQPRCVKCASKHLAADCKKRPEQKPKCANKPLIRSEGLKNKLKNTLPRQSTQILQSYITRRVFRVKQEEAYSTIKEIKAGVPQGSVLGPILYLLYTWDIPQIEDITTATFADDTAILAVGYSSEEMTTKLQEACFRINDWTRLWRM
jgi:hypothetical protein